MEKFEDALVKKAYTLALTHHDNQFRKSGEPYIVHCIETAEILRSWGITDSVMIASALTHDLLEDTPLTSKQLQAELGSEVCRIVEGVTKFITTSGETDDFATQQKIAAEGFLDPRVSILKLADRLHNMRTLEYLPPHKQLLKATETISLYAPLAESLGMWIVKTELKDLAYPYIDKVTFELVKKQIESDPRLTQNFLQGFISPIKKILRKNSIAAQVEFRRSGVRALWKKREKSAFSKAARRTTFENINDLVSIRIICDRKEICYQILGLIHDIFSELVDTDRFDEFIVSPRNNGYQALQTTLNTKAGALEIAIVTDQMERFNNWGVVSLFNQKSRRLSHYSRKIVFTQGDRVWYLPKEATALDLAYLINPALGRDTKSVRINNKRSNFSTIVPNAARVLFQIGNERVSRGKKALDLVALPRTKAYVMQELANEEWETAVCEGKSIIESNLQIQKRGIFELSQVERRLMVPFFFLNGCRSLSELHYKVGIGNVTWPVIEEYLNSLNYVKDNEAQSGFRVIGIKSDDKPGILATVATQIAKKKGNILFVENSYIDKDHFQTVLLVAGLTKRMAKAIEESLKSHLQFISIERV